MVRLHSNTSFPIGYCIMDKAHNFKCFISVDRYIFVDSIAVCPKAALMTGISTPFSNSEDANDALTNANLYVHH